MTDQTALPRHVAIILDGNGRWAKRRGRERTYGHQAGAINVRTIVGEAGKMGIKRLTLYCFSTENWKRPSYEVSFLMRLFNNYLITQLKELVDEGVQVHFVGDPGTLPRVLQKRMRECEEETAQNSKLVLNIAINYGGRQEITNAVKSIARRVRDGTLSVEGITEKTVGDSLYPTDAEDVDLLIRTGGEKRISNFLLWQISYSELYFTDTLWPDFTKADLEKAVSWYESRNRRFGGLTEDEK